MKTEHHENDANYEKATVRKQFRVIEITIKLKLLKESLHNSKPRELDHQKGSRIY